MKPQSRVRRLKPGTPIPKARHARYGTSDGYVVLRWKVGSRSYIEVLEHRVRDGFVVETEHVHHRNHVRTDNRTSNLEPISAAEHARRHESPDAGEIMRRYAVGESTTEIAAALGRNASAVFRILQRRSVTFRAQGEYLPPLDPAQIALWHAQGVRVREMARRTGRGPKSINALLDSLGLPRFRPGRPEVRNAPEVAS